MVPQASWQPVAKVPRHSTDDSSRLTALLVGRIYPIFSLLAPCRHGDLDITAGRQQSFAFKLLRAAGSRRQKSRNQSRGSKSVFHYSL